MCAEQYQLSRDAFILWSTNGKPKTGPLFHMMKSARAKFKCLVRQCKLKTNRKESGTLAQSLLQSDSRDFWKEIRKLTNNNNIILYSQSGIEHVHVQYKTYKEKKIKKYTNN